SLFFDVQLHNSRCFLRRAYLPHRWNFVSDFKKREP
ncbi:hypothetical protein MTO96_019505, partial [Rhipicephalus appendiculatus]